MNTNNKLIPYTPKPHIEQQISAPPLVDTLYEYLRDLSERLKNVAPVDWYGYPVLLIYEVYEEGAYTTTLSNVRDSYKILIKLLHALIHGEYGKPLGSQPPSLKHGTIRPRLDLNSQH